MQKDKRKAVEDGSFPAKKKKVQFDETKPDTVKEFKINNKQKGSPNKNQKKGFPKNNNNVLNIANPKSKKSKPNFVKDIGLDKSKSGFLKNKQGSKKDFKATSSKDSEQKEKPKWSEMKKEKKTLRLERRKAKATAEVFEISHKAKLLSAQIQR